MEIPRGRAGAFEGERIGLSHGVARRNREADYAALAADLPADIVPGELRLLSLGAIVDNKPGYHAFKFIWPQDYRSQRLYASVNGEGPTSWYECVILEGSTPSPLFRVRELAPNGIVCEDKTASGAFGRVHEAALRRHPQLPPRPPSGPEMFGFSLPQVVAAIEGMPSADKCVKYYFMEQRAGGAVFPDSGVGGGGGGAGAPPPAAGNIGASQAGPVIAPHLLPPASGIHHPGAQPVVDAAPGKGSGKRGGKRPRAQSQGPSGVSSGGGGADYAASAGGSLPAGADAASGGDAEASLLVPIAMTMPRVDGAAPYSLRYLFGTDDETEGQAVDIATKAAVSALPGSGGDTAAAAERSGEAAASALLSASTRTVPPLRVRQAALLEAALWAGRLEGVPEHLLPEEARDGPVTDVCRPLGGRPVLGSDGRTPSGSGPVFPQPPIPTSPAGVAACTAGGYNPSMEPFSALPLNLAPRVLEAWELLRVASGPLGLDAVLAHVAREIQAAAAHQSGGASAAGGPLPPPVLLGPRQWFDALAWDGRPESDPEGRHLMLLNAVHTVLVRYALLNLPALLNAYGPRTDVPADVSEALNRLASYVDGDTWPEFARQLMVAFAQNATGNHLYPRYATVEDEEEEAAAASGSGGGSKAGKGSRRSKAATAAATATEEEEEGIRNYAGAKADVSWVHVHAGKQVLTWFRDSHPQPVPDLPPLATEDGRNTINGAPAALASYAAPSLFPAVSSGPSSHVPAPSILARPFDAYEYARAVRERDTHARTFPPVHTPVVQPPTSEVAAGACVTEAASSGSLAIVQRNDEAVVKACQTAATALAQVDDAAAASASPAADSSSSSSPAMQADELRPVPIPSLLDAPAPQQTVVATVLHTSLMLAVGSGTAEAVAVPPKPEEPVVAPAVEAEAVEAPPPPPPSDFRLCLYSLLGVTPCDFSTDQAYMFGTIGEAVRGVSAEIKRLRRKGGAEGEDEEDEDEVDEEASDATSDAGGEGQQATISALRRLRSTLKEMIGDCSGEDAGEGEEGGGGASASSGRGRVRNPWKKTLTMRRPGEAARQQQRWEKLNKEPMVLPAGRLREAALFAFRRFLFETASSSAAAAIAADLHCFGGVIGGWVWEGPATSTSSPAAPSSAATIASLEAHLSELRACEAVRRHIACLNESELFRMPLDAEQEGLEDYYEKVTDPCDLRTVGQRLASASRSLMQQLQAARDGVPVPAPSAPVAATADADQQQPAAASSSAADLSSASASSSSSPPAPAKPWPLVLDRWASYGRSSFMTDMSKMFVNAQMFNTPGSEIFVRAGMLLERFKQLMAALNTSAVPSPSLTSPLAQQPTCNDAMVTAEAAAGFLRWPTKRSLYRNKYLRTMTQAVMPLVHQIATGEVPAVGPPSASAGVKRPAPAAGAEEEGPAAKRSRISTAAAAAAADASVSSSGGIKLVLRPSGSLNSSSSATAASAGPEASPAVPPAAAAAVVAGAAAGQVAVVVGDGAGCRRCGEGGSLVICSSCEGEYHSHCIQPPMPEDWNENDDSDWYCAECVTSGRATLAEVNAEFGASKASGSSKSKSSQRAASRPKKTTTRLPGVHQPKLHSLDAMPYAPPPPPSNAPAGASDPLKEAMIGPAAAVRLSAVPPPEEAVSAWPLVVVEAQAASTSAAGGDGDAAGTGASAGAVAGASGKSKSRGGKGKAAGAGGGTGGGGTKKGKKGTPSSEPAIAPAAAVSSAPAEPSASSTGGVEGEMELNLDGETVPSIERAAPAAAPVAAAAAASSAPQFPTEPSLLSSNLFVPAPSRDGPVPTVPTALAVNIPDVSSIGRCMQPSLADMEAKLKGEAEASTAAAPFTGGSAAAAGSVAAGAASAPPLHNPIPLAPFDLDAPPGRGGTHVEASTCLAIAPADARPLWRLAAILSQPETSDVTTLPVPVRVRLFLELVNAVTAARPLATFLENLSEAQSRARARHKRLLDQVPPETRASALARMGAPMDVVMTVKAEELKRLQSRCLPGCAWLGTRPPAYIRTLALWLPRLPPASLVDSLVMNWARNEVTQAVKGAVMGAVAAGRSASSSSSSADVSGAIRTAISESLPQLSFFLRAHYVTAYTSRSMNAPSSYGSSVARSRMFVDVERAEGRAGIVPAGIDESSSASVGGSKAAYRMKAAAVGMPRAKSTKLPSCPIPMAGGPWPELSHNAAKELASLALKMPQPSSAALEAAEASATTGRKGRGGATSTSIFTGVAASEIWSQRSSTKKPAAADSDVTGSADAMEPPTAAAASAASSEAESDDANPRLWTVRLQLAGTTRAVGTQFESEVVAGRAYDLCAWATRGPSAYRQLNFPDDLQLYESMVQTWAAGKSAEELGPKKGSVLPQSEGSPAPASSAAAATTPGGGAAAGGTPVRRSGRKGSGDGGAYEDGDDEDEEEEEQEEREGEGDVAMAEASAPSPEAAAAERPAKRSYVRRNVAPQPRALSYEPTSSFPSAAPLVSGPAPDWASADDSGSSSAVGAPIHKLSSDVNLWLIAGSEKIPISSVDDAADSAAGDEEPGCYSGMEELRWQKRASGAYPARWYQEEVVMLVKAVLVAAHDHPDIVSNGGAIPPAVWLDILHAHPFSSMRTGSDLRDHYEGLRAEGQGRWMEMVALAASQAAKDVQSRAPAISDAELKAAAVQTPALPSPAAPQGDGNETEDEDEVQPPAQAQEPAAPSPPGAPAPESFVALIERFEKLGRELPWRPTSPAQRASGDCRELEKSRSYLEWEAQLLASELSLSAMGPRAVPLGCDREGRTFYAFGAYPTELWVQGPTFATSLAMASQPTLESLQALGDKPLEWGVIDRPEQLAAAIDRLSPVGSMEGPLREALQRRQQYLAAAMEFQARIELHPASSQKAGGTADICPCGASRLVSPPGFHCEACHAAHPVGSTLSASRAAAAAHSKGCFTCLSSTRADRGQSSTRLKRQLISLAEAVDWGRLGTGSIWPPTVRASWCHRVLEARQDELSDLANELLCVLASDDVATQVISLAADEQKKAQKAVDDAPGMQADADDFITVPWVPTSFYEQFGGTQTKRVRTLAATAVQLRALSELLADQLYTSV